MFNWIKKIKKEVKDLDKSLNTYKKETKSPTTPVLAFVNQAKVLIDKQEYEKAKKVLKLALLISDKEALTYKYLGICAEKTNNMNVALKYYKKSAQINPNDKIIWQQIGMAEVHLKDYKNAEKSFENASKIFPINTDIQTGWGMALYRQKKYSEAYEKFKTAISYNRYNFSALLLAAMVEVHLNLYDEAEKKLEFLEKSNPTETLMYEFANLHFIKEDYAKAIIYAQKSIELNSSILPAYLLLGKIYSLKFDKENCTRSYQLALDNNLIIPTLYIEWGYSLIRLYEFEEAIEYFEKAKISCSSEELELLKIGLYLCYAQLNMTDEFETIKQELEDFESNSYTNEIKGLLETDKYQAIDYFKKALIQNPQSAYNYLRLAKIYKEMDNFEMTKDCYEKFINQNNKYIKAYIDYAMYLIDKKDYKNAQRKLHKGSKIDEKNQEILNLLFYVSYILVKENFSEYNIKEAINLSKQIEDFKYPELRTELEEKLKETK